MLANAVSFALITAFFGVMFALFPNPPPTQRGIGEMPWWAAIGGLVGAVQVYAGLTLVHKVGAGPFVGVTVTSALVMSLVLDHYGWFNMPTHAINSWRILGAGLMAGGVFLIAKH